jgi:tetratricopeptide (TPR) repeat protein
LRAANEGKLKQDDPVVDWARDKAVRYLASTKRYQDSLKAERLLKQIATDGNVPARFQTLYSLVLSSRADPVSILNAIEVLSELNQRGQLSKDEALLLAKLYARTNNWKLGKALMLDTLSLYGGDPQALATYINLLIGQKEYTQAAQRLSRFAEISKNNFDVFQLRAHLAHERGDQAEVKRLLRSMLPPGLNEATPLSEDQLATIKAIAGLSVSFGEYELSQNLLKLYLKRKQDGVGDLVNVMALYGNVDEALPMMEQLSEQASLPIAQLATQMVRQRRAEFGDRYDQQVAELVAASVREDPESAERLVNRAEMYEVMEKYDEAIKAYEDVMNRHELPENAQAAVMNNLAFLLAQTNQRLDEAEELVDAAIEILGPVADALDTRAVVRMARKDYPGAVEDMTLALAIDPTAIKYYHMAKAQALAGNAEGALEAWQKAQEMEIKKESLPLIEQPGFAETEQLIQNLDAVETN